MTVYKFQGEMQTDVHEYTTVAPDGTETVVREENKRPLVYIGGVPARDLEQDEWDALPDNIQRQALDTGLYKAVGAERKAASHSPASASHASPRAAAAEDKE